MCTNIGVLGTDVWPSHACAPQIAINECGAAAGGKALNSPAVGVDSPVRATRVAAINECGPGVGLRGGLDG